MRFRGSRKRCRGHGRLQRFGNQRGGGYLHALESVEKAHVPTVGRQPRNKIRSQPVVESLVHDQFELALQEITDTGHRRLERIHRHADMPAVEVSGIVDTLGLRIEQWVVVRRVDLDTDPLARPFERVPQDPYDIGGTPHGVAVLDGSRQFPVIVLATEHPVVH